MAETTTYQCPNCNGRLRFDGESGKLKCDFCESLFTPQEVEAFYAARQASADAKAAGGRAQEFSGSSDEAALAQAEAGKRAYDEALAAGKSPEEVAAAVTAAMAQTPQGVTAAQASTSDATRVAVKHSQATDPVQAYLENSRWDDADADTMRAYNCPSCGAQLMVDQVTAVTSCPYCGNNAVVPGQLSDVLKPDYVIPFKLDRNAAVAALKNYYGGKRFLPDSFTKGNHLEEVQGVYVPFWLYTGVAEGDYTFDARNVRTWTDSQNLWTETDHFKLRRMGQMTFERVPVDGSTKMPDAHMDAIEPFDYSELVPFSVAYLPGYITDRYDLDVQQCDARARRRVEATCDSAMQSSASGYAEIDVTQGNAQVNWTNVAYALLPVWMLHTKWNGQDYLFAMNGQTGKFIGDLPIDNGKVRKRFILIFLPLLIIIALVIFFLFGFGM